MKTKNTRTTVAGILAAVGVITTAVAAGIDSDPTTVMDLSGLAQAIGALLAAFGIGAGGVLAKDGDK